MSREVHRFDASLWVAVLGALLIAAMLYQRPVAELYLASPRSGVFLVHSWDLLWLVLPFVAAGAAYSLRPALKPGDVRGAVRWTDPLPWMVVLGVYAFISLIWAYSNFGRSGLSGSTAQCLHLAALVGLAILVRLCLRERRREVVVWAFIAVSSVAAAWAFLAWRLETTSGSVGAHTISFAVTRAGGPFGNEFANGSSDGWWVPPGTANGLGFWLAMCLPVSLLYGAHARRRRRVVGGLVLASVPVLVAGLVATHSRESWLAAIVACAVIGFWSLPAVPRRRKLTMVAGAMGVLAVVAVGVPSVRSRIEQTFTPGTFEYNTGPVARTRAWSLGLKWSEQRFPIGWGMGAIETHPASFEGRTTAENVYLQYFAQLGAIGLVALVGLVLTGLRRGLESVKRNPDDASGIFVAAFFAALIVHGMFGNTLGDPTIQVLGGCAIGLSMPLASRTGSASPRSAT